MKFSASLFVLLFGAAFAAAPGARAEVTNTPDFKEVYGLIRSHLAGESQNDLDRAAVQGLLTQLHSKVSLVAGQSDTNSNSEAPTLAKTALYDGPVGYLRIQRVGEGLPGQISTACKEMMAGTNEIKGLVIDLRYADRHDYAAAVAVADLFVNKAQPMLDWGGGIVRSTGRSDAIAIPVAVLVNQKTSGAAEALAAMLRESDQALVLGSNTAGEATIDQEFPLSTGQRLRIATATIKLGNGQTLPAAGLTPDISVAVSSDEERAYYDDPFKEIDKPLNLAAVTNAATNNTAANSGTNHAARPRPTEADLIRERKERPGLDMDYAPLYSSTSASDSVPEKPAVRDPVLGRALDLIKGISVLRAQHHS